MAHKLQTAELARISEDVLAHYQDENRPFSVLVSDAEHEQVIELPPRAIELLREILQALAAHQDVTIAPEKAELTTVQAAEILNVSRPFLIKLLEDGALPYRKVGTHRRIRLEDVLHYKASIDQEREAVLDQLVEDAQKQDMGY